MHTPPSPTPSSGTRRSRRFVLAFYAIFIGGTLATTWLATRHPKTEAFHRGEFMPVAKVVEVIDSASVRVVWQGAEEVLRFRGIEQASERSSELPSGRNAAQEDEIGRKALYTWMCRRPLKLIYDGDSVPRDEEGRLLAYAELYGVDVGKKLISEGRAFAKLSDHPYRDLYLEFEGKARSERRGLWRP